MGKFYTPDNLKEISFPYLYNDGDNLYLVCTGRKSAISEYDALIYKTDFDGNIVNSYELPDILYIKKIQRYDDYLYHYFYGINGEVIKTDLQGNIVNHYKDSSEFSKYQYQAEIFINDSINF